MFGLPPLLSSIYYYTLSYHLCYGPCVICFPPFVSLDANALAHEMKISAIENMVESMQPHDCVIGETKNSHQVVQRLSLRGYRLYENPGCSTGCKFAKWGVIVALSSNSTHPRCSP